MAPSLKATPTATALEARETRFYYSNGDCGDKTIYACKPGIIYGIVGAIIIGLAVIAYACYLYRDTVSLMSCQVGITAHLRQSLSRCLMLPS